MGRAEVTSASEGWCDPVTGAGVVLSYVMDQSGTHHVRVYDGCREGELLWESEPCLTREKARDQWRRRRWVYIGRGYQRVLH